MADDGYERLDRRGLRTAHHIRVMFCGALHCGPHVVLFGEDDVAFAECVIGQDQVVPVCEVMLNGIGRWPRR